MTGTKTTTKQGGNFSKDLANLSVPFGLILAQKSLEKYLNMKTPTKSTTKKTTPTTKKTTSSKKPSTNKKDSKVKSRKTIV